MGPLEKDKYVLSYILYIYTLYYIYTCSLTPLLFFGLHQKFAQPKKKLGSWLRGALSLYVAM